MAVRELRLPAIEVSQSPGRVLFQFAVDGKLVSQFATVSRIRRPDGQSLEGYQRPEVLSHIGEIRNYLESLEPIIPNAVVIAFDSRVRFEVGAPSADRPEYSRVGTLVIPIDDNLDDADKPGFIVDGQQRLAAIREAAIPRFPICVVAFVTNDVRQQTEQFILVNATKPLPKGLIYELLPNTDAPLPTLLHRRRFPAQLLDRLNRDEGSPLYHLIQTPTTPDGLIKDNSILKMLEQSLSDGVLYWYRDIEGGKGDVEAMLHVLKNYWRAVSKVFKDSWAKPPRQSRLMHGAGIIALGLLMDAIADRYRATGAPTEEQFAADLLPLKDLCRWTDGYWDFGPGYIRKWNEIQNVSRDIQLLASYLLIEYKARVWKNPKVKVGGAA